MATQLQFDKQAHDSILRGAKKVHDAVAATLGPRGNNVAIGFPGAFEPRVVHDGVTVAEAIDLEDEFENAGAQLIKSAAKRTNKDAGDGTTVTTILTYAILAECIKNITAGNNAMAIRRGIEKAVEAIKGELYSMTTSIKTAEQKQQIATISAQSEDIGKMIVAALDKVGEEGVVTVERGNTADIEIEYKEGMQFDRGWISPHFINNPATGEATVDKPVLLVTNKTVGNIQELLPLMQTIIDQHKITGIVIIAKQVIGEPLATLALNTMKGTIQAIAINAPGTGEKQDAMLEDIAMLTGATFVNEQLGKQFNELTIDDLGRADRVTSGKEQTIIVGGKGDKEKIADHVEFLRSQAKRTDISEYQMEQIRERLAKLVAGVAVINVGANSDAEADEKRERVIDAVSATRAAIDEGIVPGGETALLQASEVLARVQADSREEEIGIDIVRKAVRYPFLRLLENSGISEADATKKIDRAEWAEGTNIGIDALTGEAVDLMEAGIIDPLKVVRSALQNAASTATMLMTTGVIIMPIKEDKPNGTIELPRQ